MERRKGNPMAQISSTISKDNTLGDDVRNAKLLADFAKKRQRFAFGATDDNHIPAGAVISPPDSQQNSSDEEETKGSRGRQLENLAELQAAIRIIEQQR
jgi:hypothetical protein